MDSRMGLWAQNLGDGVVHLTGKALACSSDWHGLHLSRGSPQELGTRPNLGAGNEVGEYEQWNGSLGTESRE